MMNNDFKIGDKCFTWSLTVFGAYTPFFDEYEIINIAQDDNLSFVLLSHEDQVNMMMPIHLIFKSKNDSIEELIDLLNGLKD
jgi:hypothetical protein